MSLAEMLSREAFYKNMIWVVNAQHFKDNFIILDELPDPKAKNFTDIIIHSISSKDKGKIYHKVSEDDGSGMVRIYDLTSLKSLIINNYVGHHHFDWKRPRLVWFSADKPVLFDFGDNHLWKLMRYYPNRGMYCVKRINKISFTERANS